MIQANELRIGNLVTYKGEVQEVWQLRNESVCFHLGKDYKDRDCFQCIYLKGIEPITITEEWLDKFNLMKLDNGRYRTFKNYIIKKIGPNWFWCYLSYPDHLHILDEIQYIHQLQNKVFINTNQELTLSVT